MFGKYKFRKSQRVRPSAAGIAANIFPRTRHDQTGLVVKVDKFNFPSVLWHGRTTWQSYHPDFIEPDRRRQSGRE